MCLGIVPRGRGGRLQYELMPGCVCWGSENAPIMKDAFGGKKTYWRDPPHTSYPYLWCNIKLKGIIHKGYSQTLTFFNHGIVYAVSEIKLLFCALTGCTSHITVHPGIAPCTLPIYSNNKWLKKRAHTECTPPKIVHPAVEMCTPGAGCTLNFGHCLCWL